ncbi:MAG TPA: hypothetical protein VMG12_23075 [Polyangiaceae bacterium]|nr:hypothetical protein [Polyangiaceae bacterium]
MQLPIALLALLSAPAAAELPILSVPSAHAAVEAAADQNGSAPTTPNEKKKPTPRPKPTPKPTPQPKPVPDGCPACGMG